MTAYEPDLAAAPPIPVASLVIRAFHEGLTAAATPSRFLVDSGSHQHVVGSDVHKLLMLLLGTPPSWYALAERYATVYEHPICAAELRRTVLEKMPGNWFDSASMEVKRSPFLLQFELLTGDQLAPLTRRLAHLFSWWLAIPVIAAFLVIESIALPSAAEHIHDATGFGEVILLGVGLVVTMVCHELGHLSACARSEGNHGGMGLGLYWLFPAMYAEVSQAWRMPPSARVLVDIGGLYFQAFTVIGIGGYAILANDVLAYRLLWLVTFTMLHTLNPFFKFDGYWLLSDASGLTNLHSQLRSTVVGMARRLCGLPSPSRVNNGGRLRLVILYVYTLLCGAYLAYVIQFLHGEFKLTTQSYPALLATAIERIEAAFTGHDVGALTRAFGDVLVASAWPAMLLLFALLLGWSLLRRAASIVSELRGGVRAIEHAV